MFLKSKIYRVALACFLVLSIFSMVFADTIRLKDGSIIKGKIVSFGEGKFTIVIGDGARKRQMSFFADEIDSIEFDATMLQPSNSNKTTLPTYANTANKKDPETKSTPQPNGSKNVIITDKTTQPTTTTTNNSTQTNPTTDPVYPQSTPLKTDTQTKPVSVNMRVLADNTANGWSNSGWVVKRGQKIRISAKGQVSLGNGRYSSAAGISSLPDTDKLVKAESTGGLIAVIGDDNNDFIFIGAYREFVAARDGALFLGINEGDLTDNSGAFDVTIEILTN